ncbi:hypothetical protein SH661x_000680 [Planctomicrobium sp. SH661]|uniref:hypothetical protein n=1 Tax=Planctomicrobium sp. SH661 TaxID=3448124 RepID=UPI003F5BE807
MQCREAAAFLILACGSTVAMAQGGRGYPTVIGASGQPYGPTQAEYQYQSRYGQPSPGSQGGGLQFVNGYPGAGGGGGHGGYGGAYPFLYMDVSQYIAPPSSGYVYYPSTAYYGTFGNTNYGFPQPQPFLGTPSPQIMQPLDPNQGGAVFSNGSATFTHFPALNNPGPIVPQSTPKAQENSFEYQTEGDIQLQQLNYLVASERYRKSIEAARDRADPRYRMAVSLAARSRFLEAVDQLKLAVQLDPTWPQHATSLGQLFGEQNNFEKTRVKQRVAEWTLQDARDPNRLFLLGAMLYMDGDPNAKTMIDTAILVAGKQDYLLAFSAPRSQQAAPATTTVAPQANGNPVPNPPQPNLPLPAAPAPSPAPQLPPPQSGQPLPTKPIPAIPPLPDELPASNPPSNDPLPPPTKQDDLGGPILPPLP